MSYRKVAERGQALIELILAIAMAAVFLAALATSVIAAREGFARSGKSLKAALILQKEAEALRSVKETAWNSFASPGTYHIVQSGNGWAVASGSITENGFTRSFTVENVCRVNPTAAPVDCSNPTAKVDPSTKKIIVNISWSGFGSRGVSSSFFISRYFGNTTWLQTTVADFNAGTKTNTTVVNRLGGPTGGEVELSPGGGGSWVTPQVAASINFTGTADANDVFVLNNRVYVVGNNRTGADFFIYDVAVPTNPILLGSLDLAADGFAVVVSGNYAYVATNHASRELTVIDISNPNTPQLSGSHFNTPAAGRGIAISGNTAYLVTNNNTTSPGYEFYAINISNPRSPTQLGGLNLGAAARDIFVSGNFAYVASTSNTQELQVVNITNPSAPTLAGAFNATGNGDGLSVFVVGSTAYLAAGTSLYLLNVANPGSISQISTFAAGGTVYSVFVLGSLVFLGTDNNNQEFQVVYICTPTNPTLYGYINLSSLVNGVFAVGDYAYLASADNIAEFQVIGGGAVYAVSGTFESSIFNAGSVVGFNYLNQTSSKPACTDVKLQIATNTNGSTWNYVGPDGTGTTFFDLSGAVPLNSIAASYFRYKVFLSGDGNATPSFQDFKLNYSP